MKSLDSFIYISIKRLFSIVQPDIRLSPPFNGDSRVSRAQPRNNAYEILLQHDWLLIFSRHMIGSQKRIATYNFHII